MATRKGNGVAADAQDTATYKWGFNGGCSRKLGSSNAQRVRGFIPRVIAILKGGTTFIGESYIIATIQNK